MRASLYSRSDIINHVTPQVSPFSLHVGSIREKGRISVFQIVILTQLDECRNKNFEVQKNFGCRRVSGFTVIIWTEIPVMRLEELD